jgi:hypothetical protein
MTELELYKYIHDEDGEQPEISWRGDALIVWIHPGWFDDFVKLFVEEEYLFDDGGIECSIQSRGYLAIDLVPICEVREINPENILPKKKD